MDGGTATVIAVAIVFMSPSAIVATVLRHREKMAALKKKSEASPALAEEIRSLRQEIAEVREQATNFDLHFDAALTRVTQRVDRIEVRPVDTVVTETEPQTLYAGRGR